MSAPHRFFIDPGALERDRAALTGDQAKQVADVLRLAAGDRVILLRDGEELEVRLESVTRWRADGAVVARRPASGEPRVRLTLALPLLRGDRGEEAIEAVTQLGVSRIVPFTSERSVVTELSARKKERWQRIARESAETARRGRVPEISSLLSWNELIDRLDAPILVAWEGEHDLPLKKAIPPSIAALSVVVGPEGGLSSEEVALATSHGSAIVSLGPRNLRSETAAIAAVAQVMAVLE